MITTVLMSTKTLSSSKWTANNRTDMIITIEIYLLREQVDKVF